MAETKPRGRSRKPATSLQRALRLLARRELSRAELMARLAAPQTRPAPADTPPDAPEESIASVEQALDRLQGLGLQSDERVAESHVRSRQVRTGSRRLAAELRQRGIDSETIGAAINALADTDLQRARALWERRFESTRDPRERARQMRFLAARGFDLAVIRAVVGGSAPEEDLPPDDEGSAS